MLTALPAAEWLWEHPVSPELADAGIRAAVLHGFGTWLPTAAALPVAVLLMLFAAYGIFRRPPWWMAVLTWLFFCALTDRAWLASNGGTWLMRNAFFWAIFLCVPPSKEPSAVSPVSFWILRLQLLLAYAVSGLQKFQGTAWMDGTAPGIIASDPSYGLGEFSSAPLLTWVVLIFQITFPLAVWWGPTRVGWLLAGALFHLATALWLGIADMAFAFLVFYALIEDNEAAWMMRPFRLSTSTSAH
ncbi:MAG: HTTM domain-containing protein [Flavobacteriales bacterium]|nr:HTTM domain-containing protein [Flavobacteriales bacterium]